MASSVSGHHCCWSRSELESIRADAFADDVDLTDELVERLRLLPLEHVEAFFLDGGVLLPVLPPVPNAGEDYTPPTISYVCSPSEFAAAVRSVGTHGGLLRVSDLPVAPIMHIQCAFDDLHDAAQTGKSADPIYSPELVLKDACATAAGIESAHSADPKRIIDLNPERLAAAEDRLLSQASSCDGLAETSPQAALRAITRFWRELCDSVAPKLTAAIVSASSCPLIANDSHFDFRMVDYYERDSAPRNVAEGAGSSSAADSSKSTPPLSLRCRPHRDFGSFTLIFCTEPGLEIQWGASGSDGQGGGTQSSGAASVSRWHRVTPCPAGSALLLFGWCTQIRSNGRLQATMHRVTDGQSIAGRSVRRTSAVFFISPPDMQAPLEPVVLPGESQTYVSGVSAEAQMMYASNPLARAKMQLASSTKRPS
jgi:isopenicillin N synthase-like dioxygenase